MSIVPGNKYTGKCSSFGGPTDSGMRFDEGVAFYNNWEDNEALFLNYQPKLLKTDHGYPGMTTGIGRRLNPDRFYCAMRFNYELTSKEMLRKAQVKITFGDKSIYAQCADYGPHKRTGRIIDVSPGVMKELGCETDDTVECVLIL